MAGKKVLLMYISLHSGHHRAAVAIEKALKLIEPATEILNINSLNYTNPILEKVVNRTYISVIRRTPEVWEYLYDNPKVVKKTQKLRDLIHRFNSGKLKKLLDDFQPDAVCCTQAFPCGMVADFKKSYGLNMPLVGTLTDYVAHSYWLFDSVDAYVVPSGETRQRLIANGIHEERIKIFGIPVDPKFEKEESPDLIRQRLGFRPDGPVVLVMGGGQGLGPIKKIVESLGRMELSLQIVVITGTNKALYNWLANRRDRYNNRVLVLEYVENVNEIMQISSVVVTKPGGMTTAEALAKGLPMIIVNPIPGQEAKNTEFLLKAGVAIRARDGEEVLLFLRELLNNPDKLSLMRASARNHGRPKAALDIAKLILEM